MIRVVELTVPPATYLKVEQTFEEVKLDSGEVVALHESLRRAWRRDGTPVIWGPDTRDLFDAAGRQLDQLEPPWGLPLVGRAR